jgi:hypothetical protein
MNPGFVLSFGCIRHRFVRGYALAIIAIVAIATAMPIEADRFSGHLGDGADVLVEQF